MSLRFLANENFPLASVERLRKAGHDVAFVRQDSPGATDIAILERAVQEARFILTFDRDYGELVYRRKLSPPPGIIYFRLGRPRPQEPAARLLDLLTKGNVAFDGTFIVVERRQVRRRPFLKVVEPR